MLYNFKNGLRAVVVGIFFALLLHGDGVHAVIANGAAAVNVLGQSDGTNFASPQPIYTKSGSHDSPNRWGLNNPTGMVFDAAHHRLFVSDATNNRVLIYTLNTDNTLPDRMPDYVLGQANFVSNSATVTQSGMSNPAGLAYDGVSNRLFVADNTNRRVLIFDVSSTTNGQNAIHVLGQANFTSNVSTTTQSGMNAPSALALDETGNRLFVGETNNRRVTVFDVTTTTIADGQNAIHVLGQANFTSSVVSNTQSGINIATGLAYDSANSRLFVSQSGNNRVSIFDVASITDGENAVSVLGQTTFTGTAAASTQAGMSAPRGLVYDNSGERLFVAQSGNNRVTVYTVTTTVANGAAAINVLGQSTFTAGSATTTQAGLSGPQVALAYDSGNNMLYVPDSSNNRVMIFDVASITDGENAVNVLGQSDGTSLSNPQPLYTKAGTNDSPNRFGFSSAYNVALDTVHHRFFMADRGNNRVLVYNLNNDNTFPDRVPDYVLGQSTFTSNAAAVTQSGMTAPSSLAYDSTRDWLFVGQDAAHRVTVYDVGSITDGESAIHVLGQADFTSSGSTTTQSGMNTPQALAYDSANQRLFVGIFSTARVLVFDVASITDGENAVNVLGQSSYTSTSFTVSQSSTVSPGGLLYDGDHNRLFVAGNNRVIVFDVTDITNGENGVALLGQSNYASSTAATTQSGMNGAAGLAYDRVNQRLFVGNYLASRITVYDVAAITDGEDATHVLGQYNFTSTGASTTANGLSLPQGLAYDEGNQLLYVAEASNHRVSVFDVEPDAAPLANAAGTPVVTALATSSLGVTINTNGNTSDVRYAIRNVTTASYVTASGTATSTPVYFVSSSWSGSVLGLSPNSAYQFVAIARNIDNIDAATSSTSTVVYTLADVPENVTSTSATSDSVTVSWSGNASEYYVENASASTTSGYVTSTSYTFGGLGCNATYYFRVKGRNGDGVETAFSESTLLSVGACTSGGGTVHIGGMVTSTGGGGGGYTAPAVQSIITPPAPTALYPAIPQLLWPQDLPLPTSTSPLTPVVLPVREAFLTPAVPTSAVRIIRLPSASMLKPGRSFSYTYSYTNPLATGQTIRVVREVMGERSGRSIVNGFGTRSILARESFSFTATHLIPRTAVPGAYILRIRVYDALGRLIDHNSFRMEITK